MSFAPRDFLEQVNEFFCLPEKLIGMDEYLRLSTYFRTIESSFVINDYWELFFGFGVHAPDANSLELGVLNGYSFLAFSLGRMKRGSSSNVIGLDLFEGYKFNSGSYNAVQRQLDLMGCIHSTLKKTNTR